MHKIVVTQRITPLVNNVIFMIPLLSIFSVLSVGFAGFYDGMRVVFSTCWSYGSPCAVCDLHDIADSSGASNFFFAF